MDAAQFFAGSGLIAWVWLGWRGVVLLRGFSKRFRWALWGHRSRLVQRRY